MVSDESVQYNSLQICKLNKLLLLSHGASFCHNRRKIIDQARVRAGLLKRHPDTNYYNEIIINQTPII